MEKSLVVLGSSTDGCDTHNNGDCATCDPAPAGPAVALTRATCLAASVLC
jgi:hypothetical protein